MKVDERERKREVPRPENRLFGGKAESGKEHLYKNGVCLQQG
jgi:hypothetical protein